MFRKPYHLVYLYIVAIWNKFLNSGPVVGGHWGLLGGSGLAESVLEG